MTAPFEFATAGHIVFGAGKRGEAAAAVQALGRRPLVVTGAHPDRAAWLTRALDSYTGFAVSGEPTVDIARQGTHVAREAGCDVVVAVGGGSALDAGKAIAALISNSGEPLDYLEVIGKGMALQAPPVPFVAVPTTAGAGSEATRNAVLGSPAHRVKASLRSAAMLPRLAVIDPELMLGLPPAVTAATGLDALTQLIEPFVSRRANPMTDALCRDGIRRIAAALPRAVAHGDDLEARSGMALASLFGGIALANAGLGAVHGFAAPIGGMFPQAPHGALCAALLPHVTAVNLAALRARDPGGEPLRRYEEVAAMVPLDWPSRLGVPPLRVYGIGSEHIAEIVEKAAQASSMKGNPVELTRAELTAALSAAI